MGLLIEKYIGKTGRKLFLLFCWLFTLIVIAAFADMVAGTFNAYTVTDGVTDLSAAAQTNGAAGSISLLFIVFAMVFGVMQKTFTSYRLERNCCRTCHAPLQHWQSVWLFPISSRKRYLVLSDLCLYLPGSCTADVAV